MTLVNQSACAILGYSEKELVGKNWFDVCLPERLRETVKEVSKQVLSGESEAMEHYENPILTKSGAERVVAWHNTVLRDDEGTIIGLLSSGEDITERKRAQEELQRTLADTERMNKLMSGREDRVLELKDEVNVLLSELGREAKYGRNDT